MSTQTASTGSSEIEMGRRIADLEGEVAMLRRVIGAQSHLAEFMDRYGCPERDIQAKLHGIAETNSVWMAVNMVLRQMILNERTGTRANLSNEDMRWYVARCAALEDYQSAIHELWAKANKAIKAS